MIFDYIGSTVVALHRREVFPIISAGATVGNAGTTVGNGGNVEGRGFNVFLHAGNVTAVVNARNFTYVRKLIRGGSKFMGVPGPGGRRLFF